MTATLPAGEPRASGQTTAALTRHTRCWATVSRRGRPCAIGAQWILVIRGCSAGGRPRPRSRRWHYGSPQRRLVTHQRRPHRGCVASVPHRLRPLPTQPTTNKRRRALRSPLGRIRAMRPILWRWTQTRHARVGHRPRCSSRAPDCHSRTTPTPDRHHSPGDRQGVTVRTHTARRPRGEKEPPVAVGAGGLNPVLPGTHWGINDQPARTPHDRQPEFVAPTFNGPTTYSRSTHRRPATLAGLRGKVLHPHSCRPP